MVVSFFDSNMPLGKPAKIFLQYIAEYVPRRHGQTCRGKRPAIGHRKIMKIINKFSRRMDSTCREGSSFILDRKMGPQKIPPPRTVVFQLLPTIIFPILFGQHNRKMVEPHNLHFMNILGKILVGIPPPITTIRATMVNEVPKKARKNFTESFIRMSAPYQASYAG
jgi:hypothetical protein